MHWHHNCSAEWLTARRNFITATNVVDLEPTYRRLKGKGLEDSPALIGLWGEKFNHCTEDTSSVGPAARGHILEPYALDELKQLVPHPIFHWDDKIINRGFIGFSPDALSISEEPYGVVTPYDQLTPAPKVAYEVKSYSPKVYLQTIYTDKKKCKERFQIATGFYVCPSLEEFFLVLYNPSCSVPIYYKIYYREDLEDEIAMVETINEAWGKCKDNRNKELAGWFRKPLITEEEINDIMVKEEVNDLLKFG